MCKHVWFEGNFVLSLRGATILNTAFEKWSIFKQLSVDNERYFLEGLKITSFKNIIPTFIPYWKPEKWKTYITMYFIVKFHTM